MEPISIDDLKKVQIRIGEIISAEPIEGSDKLLKLKVNFGTEERQVLSGIAKFVQAADLVGKRYPFVTNLAPRMMMGLESQAMLLAASGPSTTLGVNEEQLYLFETQAPAGTLAK